jgi:two-component system sensor kinase FixL
VTHDDSAHLLTEQQRISEMRHKHFTDLSEDSIWCLGLDVPIPEGAPAEECARLLLERSKFVEINSAFQKRYATESALHQRPLDLGSFWIHGQDEKILLAAQTRFNRRELSLEEVDEQGRVRHLTCTLYGVEGKNGLEAVWGVERDVTGQVEEDQLLRQSQAFYKTISETALDGICVLDGELNLIDCNDAFAELARMPRHELLESESVVLQPLIGMQEEPVSVRSFRKAGRWRGNALLRQDRHGVKLHIELACRVTGSGADERYYCFVRDLSERRSAEKRESEHQRALAHVARLSTLGEMTSGIAHELNQPLAAIVNYAGGCARILNAQGYDDPHVLKGLESIAEQGDRAADIIRRMRSFARREGDKREPFHVSDVLSEAIQLSLTDSHKVGIRIDTDFAPTSDTVVVDGIQIEQVTLNLIRNSIDALISEGAPQPSASGKSPAAPRKGGEDRFVRISTRVTALDPAASPAGSSTGLALEDTATVIVTVTIEDNGPGISPDVAARMFEPFFKAGGNGIGLGLTISRSIIESHGGRLWFTPGEDGAAFHFTLPVRTAPIAE